MIPSVILVGLVAALATSAGAHLRPFLVVGVLVSLGWGLVVAPAGAFAGGTMLAIPNYLVGALVGWSVFRLLTNSRRSVERRRA